MNKVPFSLKTILLTSLVAGWITPAGAQSPQESPDQVSRVWVADQGKGTYKNPVLTSAKPKVKKAAAVVTPPESDEFSSPKWANGKAPKWAFSAPAKHRPTIQAMWRSIGSG